MYVSVGTYVVHNMRTLRIYEEVRCELIRITKNEWMYLDEIRKRKKAEVISVDLSVDKCKNNLKGQPNSRGDNINSSGWLSKKLNTKTKTNKYYHSRSRRNRKLFIRLALQLQRRRTDDLNISSLIIKTKPKTYEICWISPQQTYEN